MKTKKLLPLLTVLLTLAACGGDGDDIIVQHNTQKSGNTALSRLRRATNFPNCREVTAKPSSTPQSPTE